MIENRDHRETAARKSSDPRSDEASPQKAASSAGRETIIAGVAIGAILLHLILRFALQVSPYIYDSPLWLVLVLGGAPLILTLAKKALAQDKDCALAETENLFWLFIEERCNALLRIAGFSVWAGSSRHRARRVVFCSIVQFKPREIIHNASRSTHGSTKRS